VDSSFLRIHRKCLGPDIAVAWGQTSKVVSTCDNGRKCGVDVAVAWLARSFTNVCTLVPSGGANKRHSCDAILRAPSLSLSFPTSVSLSFFQTTTSTLLLQSLYARQVLAPFGSFAPECSPTFSLAPPPQGSRRLIAQLRPGSLGISKCTRPSQSAS
jgi:hypothetical protein